MAFSYCPHCGFKNMYSLQAPSFCGGCGEGLNILSAAKQTSSSPAKAKAITKRLLPKRGRPIPDLDDDPEGLDIYEVPNISKLSYSIERDNNKFSLKDIMPMEQFQDFKEEKNVVKAKQKKTRGRPRKN
jgi:hypothetical protein